MPGQNTSAEAYATELYDIVSSTLPELIEFCRSISATQAEQQRILLTTRLVPVAIGRVHVELTNSRLLSFLSEVERIYLRKFENWQSAVRWGDYVVWTLEQNMIIDLLNQKNGSELPHSYLPNLRLPFWLLLESLFETRSKFLFTDTQMALRASTEGGPPQMLPGAVLNYAASFTKQTLAFDPSTLGDNPYTSERVISSIRGIGELLAVISFCVTKLLDKCEAMIPSAATPTARIITQELRLRRMSQIGERLIRIESQSPGAVRMATNPFRIHAAAERMKDLGFKKRMFQSEQQFVADCFLSYQVAAEALLPFCAFSGHMDEGRIHCWTGTGEYSGWQGVLQLPNFLEGGEHKKQLVFIINAQPFFDAISDLLDDRPNV